MSVVALVVWITTAGGGLYLLSIWLIEYDKDFQAAAATRLPPLVLAGHVLLAVGGLIVWAAYLFFDNDDLTWVALAALVMAAMLGLFMASRWIRVYRAGQVVALAEPVAQYGMNGAARDHGGAAARFGEAFDPVYPRSGNGHQDVRDPARTGAGLGRRGLGHRDPGRGDPGRREPGRREPDDRDLGRREAGRPGLGRQELGRRELGRTQAGPPERNFPLPVVIGHGLFAAVTITLVLLVALGVGGN
jgi:hypothetical protein